MTFEYNGIYYDVIIEKKRTTKNTYIRVKDDLNIYVTTNIFTSDRYIEKLLKDNYKSVCKMIDKEAIKIDNNLDFNYLGKTYKIVYGDFKKIEFSDDKVYMSKSFNVDAWYKKQAKKIFLEHLNYYYENFSRNIPYPSLRIRKMTTRWGVCNTKSHAITLNLELIKRDTKYLDYVICHELSHLVEANHSKAFWKVVEENYPKYKEARRDMRYF